MSTVENFFTVSAFSDFLRFQLLSLILGVTQSSNNKDKEKTNENDKSLTGEL